MVVEIDGDNLTIDEIILVARQNEEVVLADSARGKITRSRNIVESAIRDGRTVYGVNTGFGSLSDVTISEEDLTQLQINLIRSHSAGVGPSFSKDIVRGIMLLRANALAKGYSGVRVEIIETLIQMLNRGVVPVIPQQGSVGSSGDLAPLAHMALVMMGEGEAYYGEEQGDGNTALIVAGIEPVTLQAKEGVALINGTQPMSAVGSLVVSDARALMRNAVIAAAMSLEALKGTRTAFDERIQTIRPHQGQSDIAKAMRLILSDSEINESHKDCGKIQDAYSLRCIPQVLGSSLDAIRYTQGVLEIEVNSATDNPLIFAKDRDILSGGNFHGQPVALAMDFLGIALSEIANISERRINRLQNPNLSELPAFLTKESGLESGLMIAQYTAAALVSENKVLAHPASVDSIPTSADQEDHVSMGTIAARKAMQILGNVKNVIAIEYLCATQGVDLLAPLKPSAPLEEARTTIRQDVTLLEDDRPLTGDISRIRTLIDNGVIVESVEKITGPLFEA